MAKARRVTAAAKIAAERDVIGTRAGDRLDPLRYAVALLAGSIVYVFYYPSDSVSVEHGDALWLGVLGLIVATVTWSVAYRPASGSTEGRASLILDATPWVLGGWMMFAAFATSPPGNLRMATNEAWLWVTAAALFTSSRRLMADTYARRAIVLLIVVGATGLATHGLHQHWISLPANRAEYRQDPERILRLAGVDAPAGSSERMVFENRLFDGGPTATFALANSLAAVLVFAVVGGCGVLCLTWRELTPRDRVAWGLTIVLCAVCLLAARSRSALLATLIGFAILLVVGAGWHTRGTRAIRRGLIGFGVLAAITSGLLGLLGNREWFEQAPASLAFRLHYWKSTWLMVRERPWFAAGPGNFQSIYERYRDPTMTEQVAEPHNFLFETLGSGGLLALALLGVTLLAAVRVMLARDARTPNEAAGTPSPAIQPCGPASGTPTDANRPIQGAGRWTALGAGAALVAIWTIGWITRRPPDFTAHQFAVPVALAAAVALWPSLRAMRSRPLDLTVGVALIALLIHLSAAGGWTVPGVAILVWIGGAMLTRILWSAAGSRRTVVVIVGGGLLMLTAIYLVSLRPVDARQRWLMAAQAAQAMGRQGRVPEALRHAVQADPWSPEATLWSADHLRWKMIVRGDTSRDRAEWQRMLDESLRRGGDDPAIYRQVGTQQLHLYQRFGRPQDLVAAEETFGAAARWGPANEWMIAQLAAIVRARGDQATARRLAEKAKQLSLGGGNIERALSRQQIYLPTPLGIAADRGPVRATAESLLFEPSGGQSRSPAQ